ncbi:STAS domain-containing protein [Streptomyces sp. NPDC051776]|uniref:STAS domain-containing protein n=1 Tax=Streptomyces sp. NPDC051776 TaxID=3155414 RepID=UPI00342546E6
MRWEAVRVARPPDLDIAPLPIGKDDALTLHLSGELSVWTMPTLRDEVVHRCRNGNRRLRLDLSGVSVCEVATLYGLIGLMHGVHAARGYMCLIALSDAVMQAMTRSGLDPRVLLWDLFRDSRQVRS